jgi:excisionase family DNA binding protein
VATENGHEARLSDYLTADEVAAILRLSPKTIYRLAKSDPTLPMLKLGGAVRFPRERLLRWLAMREQGNRRTRHPLYSPANSAENRESSSVKSPMGPVVG